jgi:hypothetical protein
MADALLYQVIETEEKREDDESDGTNTDTQLNELRQQLKEAKGLAVAEKEAAVAEKEATAAAVVVEKEAAVAAAVVAAVTENDAKNEAALVSLEQQMKIQYQGLQVSTCCALCSCVFLILCVH